MGFNLVAGWNKNIRRRCRRVDRNARQGFIMIQPKTAKVSISSAQRLS